MPCEVCEKIELEILAEDDDVSLDVDFEGEFLSGSTGEEYQNGYDVGYAEGEEAGYEKGKAEGGGSGYERYATQIQFSNLNLFGKEEIVLNLDSATNLAYLCMAEATAQNTTVKHIVVNCPNQVTSMRSSFSGSNIYDQTLEHITLNVDTSLSQWWIDTFCRIYNLKIIDGKPLDLRSVNSNGYSRTFYLCKELVEVRFAEKSIVENISFSNCSKLSDTSIQSIIDGLADLTGGTAQTLTVHPDVKAKIVANPLWLAAIVGKNWTLA